MEGTPLSRQQTGNWPLPRWAYTEHVAGWVRELAKQDRMDSETVMSHAGFTENAYRFVFAYEKRYPNVTPHLMTILPSGQVENDKHLEPKEEGSLIAYTYCQKIEEGIAKQHLASKFVWKHNAQEFRVLQTWPSKFNDEFKKTFTLAKINPDPAHFNDDALQEFTQTMRDLFQVPKEETELPVYFAQKATQNEMRSYEGHGENLMSLLRTYKGIRDHLNIVSLVEPNGFVCKFVDKKGGTGIKHFYMDITKRYVLYTKVGWETMACVKPKFQFDRECQYDDTGEHAHTLEFCKPDKSPPEGEISYLLDLDWFAGQAYPYVLRSALVVWACAIVVMLLRVTAMFAGDLQEWFDDPAVLLVMAAVAVVFGLYSDVRAMGWCVVPWLQRVGPPRIMTIVCPFYFFLALRLSSTCLQIITIQTNAWFMVTAVEQSEKNQRFWEYLWQNSMFKFFLPDSTWESVTPAGLAIVLWLLSLGQLLQPLAAGTPWGEKRAKPRFPARGKVRARPEEGSDAFEILCPKEIAQGFFQDFHTPLGKVCQALGSKLSRKCTYRQSVAMLAFASGLRYVGSPSISYPRQLIKDIIDFRRGYKIRTDVGYEAMLQGWEMRALKEFLQLSRQHFHRLNYVMFLKLALQMNLQISVFIMDRMRRDKENFLEQISRGEIDSREVASLVSIASLIVTFIVECIDAVLILLTFRTTHKAVKEKVQSIGKEDHYAYDDFNAGDGSGDGDQRVEYTGRDLKAEYYWAWIEVCRMLVMIIICVWLIGYALSKFAAACYCKDGAWELSTGCLERCDACFNDFPVAAA